MNARTEDWGVVEYAEAWRRQEAIFEQVLAGESDGRVIFCQHPHVYTLGRSGRMENMLGGAAVVRTNRGGDMTYHGPGQVVVYPVMRLKCGLREYVERLEEAVIATLAEFGVAGRRIAGKTGVWVGGKKICAIGVRASRGVVMHGLALNVTTDLGWFEAINPCGMAGAEVTSVGREAGDVEIDEVKAVLHKNLEQYLCGRGVVI